MDSLPVLRRQTQNKIRSNLQSENKAPADCPPNPPIQQSRSKIPVLAKTLCLQNSSDFKQSYKKWEEKPLPGKVKERRHLTRTVPFSLSNRKHTQKAVEVHKSLTASQSKSQVSNASKSHGSSVPGEIVQNKGSSAQPGAEVALGNMNLLSLKEPSKSSNAELPMAKSTSVKALNDKKNEQKELTALRSVKVLTPKSKLFNDLPQRVSVKKSQRKAGPLAVRCVQFSPDSDALQSILQNEGVKAGGPLGAISRDSVCPSNRGTSIYSAQRVPLRKNKAETNGGPVEAAVKETTVMTKTPQRVRNTKHLPMSMKSYQTPYITHGSRNFKLNLQKLFDADDEGTAGPGKDPETQPEQFSEQATTKTTCSKPAEICRNKTDIADEPKTLSAQPRESVIMFSSKKLLRVPSSYLKVSAPLDQVSSDDKRNLSEARSETPADPAHPSHPSVLRLHRDLTTQKTRYLSTAVIMLRKRFPPLEEQRLDDEVSTYTSKSVDAGSLPRFLLPRPRCKNPVASILQFEESTRFIPISPDCPSLHISQQHTR